MMSNKARVLLENSTSFNNGVIFMQRKRKIAASGSVFVVPIRLVASAILLPISVAFAGGMACPAAAQTVLDNNSSLENAIAAQQVKLNQEELQLEQQSLEISQQQQLLDSELSKLRGTGTRAVNKANTTFQAPGVMDDAGGGGQQPGATQAVGAEQQQEQENNEQDQTKVILQSSSVLSGTGGVLTPKGTLVIDPSVEYDYWTQNQLNLNGFTIIPGITFGNIYISRVDQHFLTGAVTARYGLSNRWEINLKVPVVSGFGTTTAQEAGPSALPTTASTSNLNIGDVQIGTSYQFDSSDSGWPVLVGNFIFKTTTGQSPYNVPIYDAANSTNELLFGLPKKLPTGTGFYSIEPSLTFFYPTAPGVLFGNLQYIYNFARSFDIPNPAGGPSTVENLAPGMAVAGTFGFGFAMNDRVSMTLSYQQEHVFGAAVDNHGVVGSAYDFGTFNFGLGYEVSPRTNVNVGVGMGVGPYAPAAKILIEVPMRFNIM